MQNILVNLSIDNEILSLYTVKHDRFVYNIGCKADGT